MSHLREVKRNGRGQVSTVMRDDQGRIVKGSGPLNPGGRSGSERTQLERRFYCALERLSRKGKSVEVLAQRMIDAIHTKQSDDPLAHLLVRESINRIAPLRSALDVEHSGPGGGPIEILSDSERSRLATLLGEAFQRGEGVVIDVTPSPVPGSAD